MKKLALFIGLFAFLILAGIARADCIGTASDCETYPNLFPSDPYPSGGYYGCSNGGINLECAPVFECAGTYDCSVFTDIDSCENWIGGEYCTWNEGESICEGSGNCIVILEFLGNPQMCIDLGVPAGCTLNKYCAGDVVSCNSLSNQSICESQSGCSWSSGITLNLTFVFPTPINGTSINSTSFMANVSSNGTVSLCTLTLDGSNYSMTIAAGNLSASKANSGISQGIHRYNATCDGFMTETRALSVDSIAPNITITSPQNITYNNVSQANLNVSASETISTWWYSINGGSNTTFTPNITINIANGSNVLFVYANDSIGNIGKANVSFMGNYPTVTYLNSPDDGNETISSVPINMTFNCSAINDVNLANITLYINGIPNETKSVTGIYNFSIFIKALSLGDYNWTCRACDYADQCSFGVPSRTLSIASPPSPITGYMTSVTRGFLLLIPLIIAVIIILLMLSRLETLNLESLIEMGVIAIVMIALTAVLSTII